jgi:hypothetical protein
MGIEKPQYAQYHNPAIAAMSKPIANWFFVVFFFVYMISFALGIWIMEKIKVFLCISILCHWVDRTVLRQG